MRHEWTVMAMVVMALGGALRPAAAQIDYRNLDDDRPLTTEDAYPVERYAFEALFPYSLEREADGHAVHALVPELAWGFARNAQWGIKLPLAAVDVGGSTDWGVAGLLAFGLYNLNTESPLLPSLSGRLDLHLPVGSLGGDATRVGLKLIATRTWGRSRIHANLAWTLGDEDGLAAVEPGSRWSHSLAVDRTLFRQSLLLIGEVVVRRAVEGTPVEVNAGVGTRYQWTPTVVLDLGIRRRLRAEGPDIALTAGLSHAFALPGLMPRRSAD